jgi:hypothetical protein
MLIDLPQRPDPFGPRTASSCATSRSIRVGAPSEGLRIAVYDVPRHPPTMSRHIKWWALEDLNL